MINKSIKYEICRGYHKEWNVSRSRSVKLSKRGRIALKYISVVLVSIILFINCSIAADAQRGYKAIGGENLIILLPFLFILVEINIRDIKEELTSKKIQT